MPYLYSGGYLTVVKDNWNFRSLEAADRGVLWPVTLTKKRLWHRCFSVNFEILRTPFFPGHLRATASSSSKDGKKKHRKRYLFRLLPNDVRRKEIYKGMTY